MTYTQPNKLVGVRLTDEVMARVDELARERRWSRASAVAYCVEHYFDLEPSDTIVRRGYRG